MWDAPARVGLTDSAPSLLTYGKDTHHPTFGHWRCGHDHPHYLFCRACLPRGLVHGVDAAFPHGSLHPQAGKCGPRRGRHEGRRAVAVGRAAVGFPANARRVRSSGRSAQRDPQPSDRTCISLTGRACLPPRQDAACTSCPDSAPPQDDPSATPCCGALCRRVSGGRMSVYHHVYLPICIATGR